MSYEEICSSHPKARNRYYCEWCGQKIEIEEKHFSRAYKFEGDFIRGRMHLECEVAMNNTRYDIVSEGWVMGEPTRGEPLTLTHI